MISCQFAAARRAPITSATTGPSLYAGIRTETVSGAATMSGDGRFLASRRAGGERGDDPVPGDRAGAIVPRLPERSRPLRPGGEIGEAGANRCRLGRAHEPVHAVLDELEHAA